MIRILTAVFLCLFNVGLAQADTLPALFDVSGVAADDVLNLRAEPNAEAALMGALAPDASGVEVTALSPDGRWGRVASGEISAWASMRFLQRMPGPDWDAMQRPLACYGTEPFWTLDISGQGDLAFRSMDGPEIGLSSNWFAATAGQRGIVGMAVSGAARSGFLTLVGQDCSDGMSDRLSGIAMTLFLHGDDGTTGFSGCCSLLR